MTAATRLVTRLLVVVALLSAAAATPHAPRGGATVGDASATGEQAVTRSEVRLRKLHLVRPDLIPYPIAYEVCC